MSSSRTRTDKAAAWEWAWRRCVPQVAPEFFALTWQAATLSGRFTFVSEHGHVPSNAEVCAILSAGDGGRPPQNFKGLVSDVMKAMRTRGEIE